MTSLKLLERVLPDEGYYCVTTIRANGKPSNLFVETKQQLANICAQAAAVPGNEVYHACSTYKEKGSREITNIHSIKSIWCDLDVATPHDKKPKPYQTQTEAIGAIRAFMTKTNWPAPTMVSSGYGVHCYWPLEKALSWKEWKPLADGFKVLAKNMGLHIDQGITGDGSRILRTPGTFNHKGEAPKPVSLMGSPDKILTEMHLFPLRAAKVAAPTVTKGPREKDAKLEKILAGCAQMSQFAKGVEQNGVTWIACGRVLAQCEEGTQELWHEWSSKSAQYNEAEAQKKWEDSVAFDNGINCERFKEVNPDGCKGCTATCKSPVQLGRSAVIKINLPADAASRIEKHTFVFPFSCASDGRLVTRKRMQDGEYEEVTINEFPVLITQRAEVEGRKLGMVVEVHKPKEGWSSHTVELSALAVNPSLALANLGVIPENVKLMTDYIRKQYNQLCRDKETIQMYDSFGWKGDKFLWVDGLYSVANKRLVREEVTLSGDAAALAPHLRPGGKAKRGSVVGWRNAAQGLMSVGHEWQAVTLFAAAGAPLLGLLGEAEGGTIWSLFETKGGRGKTTAVLAGASVWGSYEGLSTSPSDTVNARLAKLGTLRHLPFAYDEMKRDNPAVAKGFVQAFTAGQDRARLGRDGSVAAHTKGWRTIMLTSANSELSAAIEAEGGSTAMADRVFEIHASDLPLSKKEMNASIKREFEQNSGWAGLVILYSMLADVNATRELLAEKEAYYMNLLADTKMRFRAQLIAIVDVVSTMIAKSGLLVFEPAYYTNWLVEQATDRLPTPQIEPVELLSEYLRAHAGETIYLNSFRPRSEKVFVDVRGGKVSVRVNKDTNEIIIPKLEFKKYLQKRDQSENEVMKSLLASKILIDKGAKRCLSGGTQIPSAQETCLIFNGKHSLLSDSPPLVETEEDDQKVVDITQSPANAKRPFGSLRPSVPAR